MLRLWLSAWLSACLAAVACAQDDWVKSIALKTHSLYHPYLDSELQSRWFDFGGDTLIRPDKYIRLTADRPSQSGWIFSRVPLTATNWEIEVEFSIHGKGNLFGDGMAMWVTKERAQQGPVFGFVDKFDGLGIFFDTYKNHRPGVVFPYVMAMLGDGKTAYDSPNDGKANELAGCSVRGLHNLEFPAKARLTYFQDKNLRMELMYKSQGEWTTCFDAPNVKIPSVAYLGFSAATGELSDNHDIIKVEAKNLYNPNTPPGGADSADKSGKAEYDYLQKGRSFDPNKGRSSSGWSWFFLKLVLVLLVLAVAYVAFNMYRTSARQSRF